MVTDTTTEAPRTSKWATVNGDIARIRVNPHENLVVEFFDAGPRQSRIADFRIVFDKDHQSSVTCEPGKYMYNVFKEVQSDRFSCRGYEADPSNPQGPIIVT